MGARVQQTRPQEQKVNQNKCLASQCHIREVRNEVYTNLFAFQVKTKKTAPKMTNKST